MTIHFTSIVNNENNTKDLEVIENFNSLIIYEPNIRGDYEVRINGKLICATKSLNYVNYIKSTIANALNTGKNYLDLKYKLTQYKETTKYEG